MESYKVVDHDKELTCLSVENAAGLFNVENIMICRSP